MGLFGMAVAEVISLERLLEAKTKENTDIQKSLIDADKKAELILKEASLEADKILYQAEKEAGEVIDRKNKIEQNLKEFIQAEKELIKKYES